jgi:hypothetical protein
MRPRVPTTVIKEHLEELKKILKLHTSHEPSEYITTTQGLRSFTVNYNFPIEGKLNGNIVIHKTQVSQHVYDLGFRGEAFVHAVRSRKGTTRIQDKRKLYKEATS